LKPALPTLRPAMGDKHFCPQPEEQLTSLKPIL